MTTHLEHDARRRRNGDAGDTMRDHGLGPAHAPPARRPVNPHLAIAIIALILTLTLIAAAIVFRTFGPP